MTMTFSETDKSHEFTLRELKNKTNTVRLAVQRYLFHQHRIQVFVWDGNHSELEMCTYHETRAEDAVARLQAALKPLPDDCSFEDLRAALDQVVKSYGGDPQDSRQRLDMLIEGVPRYW